MSKCPICGRIVIDLAKDPDTREVIGCRHCVGSCSTCGREYDNDDD